MLFSVLALLDASTRIIGSIGFWFHAIASHQLWPFCANLDRRWTSSKSAERCPCDVVFAKNLANFEIIFASASFMPKTSVKIAWHEPNDMPTSLIVTIRRLSKIIFSTAMCELVSYRDAKSMFGFATILCVSDKLLIDRTTLWQEFMMHHAIAIEENSEQNLHI